MDISETENQKNSSTTKPQNQTSTEQQENQGSVRQNNNNKNRNNNNKRNYDDNRNYNNNNRGNNNNNYYRNKNNNNNNNNKYRSHNNIDYYERNYDNQDNRNRQYNNNNNNNRKNYNNDNRRGNYYQSNNYQKNSYSQRDIKQKYVVKNDNENEQQQNRQQNDNKDKPGKKQPVMIGKSFQKTRNNRNNDQNRGGIQKRNQNRRDNQQNKSGQQGVQEEEKKQNNYLEGNEEDLDQEEEDYENDDGSDIDDDVPLSQLTETLIKKVKRGRIECLICCQKVKVSNKIWNCKRCFQPFHLGCTKKWIEANPDNKKKSSKDNLTWSCPKCQYIYAEKMPEYFCFCDKIKYPEFDKYILPHSCGDVCLKKRGKNCIHPCQMLCHPGPCKPCSKQGPVIKCFCGQCEKQIQCSDDITSFKCDQVCEKLLNCGIHKCERLCHEGPCSPCTIELDNVCYCGKETVKGKCGDEQFSCKKVCDKVIDCGKHNCKYLCHEGPCEPCQLKPELVKKCPCEKFDLSMLVGDDKRTDCTDLIPTCGLPCKQLLPCGEHYCTKTCHNGDCDDCQEEVSETCRCGETTQRIKCHETYDPLREEYICHKRCKKTLSCKKHKCAIECCTAKNGEDINGVHLCLKVCSKKLNCKKHECALFCHIGECKKCPIIIQEPLSCPCGKSYKLPPNPCGTTMPECNHPCSRERECGHKCPSKCHYDRCRPCEEPVDKKCRCGSQVIKNVACSKEALCLNVCGKVLKCGHLCDVKCHTGECPKNLSTVNNPSAICYQKCNKKKKYCEHLCTQQCHHGKECLQEPCQVETRVKCICGNREAFVECGAYDEKVVHTLECNQTCANKQRFGIFYQNNLDKHAYYPSSLLRFANFNMSQLLKIEQKIELMVQKGQETLEIPFPQDQQKKQAIQILITRHYNMEIQYYNHFKNPFFVVRQTENMIIPKPLLSDYYKSVQKGKIKPEVLPFETIIKFHNLNTQDNVQQLDSILKDFQQDYYIEKIDQNSMNCMFWQDFVAQKAQKKLKKSQSCFQNFTVEFNESLEHEQQQQELNLTQVVRKTLNKKLQGNDSDEDVMTLEKKQASKNLNQRKKQMEIEASFQEYSEEDLKVREQFKDRATLYEFCSKKEIIRREKEMDINLFEQDPHQKEMHFHPFYAMKKYERIGQNEQTKEDIRSPDVLNKAMWYIIENIIDCDTYINTPYKLPTDKKTGKKRVHTFIDVYEFTSDRVKAIRQDLTVLGNPSVPQALETLELISCFYILSVAEGMIYEEIDVNMIIFELEAVLNTLREAYEKTEDEDSKQHADFYYSFLLLLNSKNSVNYTQALQSLPQSILDSEYSKYDLTLEEYKNEVMFDDDEVTLEFFQQHGINTENLEGPDEYETEEEEEKEEEEEEQKKEEQKEEVEKEAEKKQDEEQDKPKEIVFKSRGQLKFTNSKKQKKEEEEKKKQQRKIKKKYIEWSSCKKIKVKNLQKDDPIQWKEYCRILHILLEKKQTTKFTQEQIDDHHELPREQPSLVSRSFIINVFY